jgi:hypothetical protein
VSPDARTHYVNVGFDLELRPRVRPGEHERLDRQIRQLSVQGLLGARTGDAALVLTEVADEFLEHLDGSGIPVPRVLHPPDIDPDSRFRPFGWSAEAIELNRRHHRPCEHPSLPVIRRVNSRSFGLELERELFPETATGAVVDDIAALEKRLSMPSPSGEWIVKGEFGNSGLANRRLRSSALSRTDRRFVDGLLANGDRVVVEPWLPRERDWSVVFEVPFEAATLRRYETFHTRDGALIGALLEPERTAEIPWGDESDTTAERVAARLEEEGYFGPVCVDGFSWLDENRLRFRHLIDVNCRQPMSRVAYRLWREIGADRVFLYRFFNRRKLSLPRTLPQVLAALGSRRYDRERRRGILLVSPPDHTKLGVIFAGENRQDAFALEAELRARFEA